MKSHTLMASVFFLSFIPNFLVGNSYNVTQQSGNNHTLFTQSPTDNPDQSQPEDLRLELNRDFLEHSSLAATHLKLLFDGMDTSRSRELLEENGNKIADAVSSIIDTDMRNQFLSLWMRHIDEYERYTTALKNDDQDSMDLARENLDQVSDEIGTLVTQNSADQSQIAQHMRVHGDITLSIVNTFPSNDTLEMMNRIKVATEQAEKFADDLTNVLDQY